jgi:hypothetical protein
VLWPTTVTTEADQPRPAWQQGGALYGELARLTDITWQQTGQRLAVHHIARTSTDQAGITIGLDGVGFLDDGLRPLPAGQATAAFGDALKSLLGEAIASFGFLTLHTRTENGNLLLISKDPIFDTEDITGEDTHGAAKSGDKVAAPIPALQFKSPPGPAPAGHRMIDRTTGDNTALQHDIAAVVAALKLIERPVGGQRFWRDQIKGQWTPKLMQTIKDFQAASGLEPSGRIDPGSDTEAHLLGRLPGDKQRLRGLPGSSQVYVQGMTRTEAIDLDPLDALIPSNIQPLLGVDSKLSRELKALMEKLEQATGIRFTLEKATAIPGKTGYFYLRPDRVMWLNPAGGKTAPGLLPPALINAARKIVDASGLFAFYGNNQIVLATRKILTPEFFVKIGMHDVAQYIVMMNDALMDKAGINLVEAVGHGKSAGELGAAIILDKLSNTPITAAKAAERMGIVFFNQVEWVISDSHVALIFTQKRGYILPEHISRLIPEKPVSSVFFLAKVEKAFNAASGSLPTGIRAAGFEVVLYGGLRSFQYIAGKMDGIEASVTFGTDAAKSLTAGVIAAAILAFAGVFLPITLGVGIVAGVVISSFIGARLDQLDSDYEITRNLISLARVIDEEIDKALSVLGSEAIDFQRSLKPQYLIPD